MLVVYNPAEGAGGTWYEYKLKADFFHYQILLTMKWKFHQWIKEIIFTDTTSKQVHPHTHEYYN